MKRTLFTALCVLSTALCCADSTDLDIIEEHAPIQELSTWDRVPSVAEYKLADWDNVVMRVNGITPEKAIEIAETNPDVDYFFITTGYQMVLENREVYPEIYRIFHYGDTVFFSGEPWWGSAPGLADGYIKISE